MGVVREGVDEAKTGLTKKKREKNTTKARNTKAHKQSNKKVSTIIEAQSGRIQRSRLRAVQLSLNLRVKQGRVGKKPKELAL